MCTLQDLTVAAQIGRVDTTLLLLSPALLLVRRLEPLLIHNHLVRLIVVFAQMLGTVLKKEVAGSVTVMA